ncbi:MAG: FAD-dependent oxidoreductase, partial [Armatimonadota bacterium]
MSAAIAALLALSMAMPAPPFPFERDRVLDIERLRAVRCAVNPSDTSEFADVLVVGGGVGGCAAALAVASAGYSVILIEPTRALGGQLTTQLVPVPDENSHIEKEPGPASRSWRALRSRVRALCALIPGAKPEHTDNFGQCWVSRVSALPAIWEAALADQMEPRRRDGRIKAVLTRHQIRSVGLYSGDGRFNWADVVDLDNGKVSRIAAKFAIDATEDGALMALAGTPTRLGQEAASEFGEPHAPAESHPEWVQSFTYGFLMRWTAENEPRSVVAPPPEYDVFHSFGEYTLDYVYRGQTPEPFSVPYKVLRGVEGEYGGKARRYLPFWTYRRLQAASSLHGGKSPVGDIALINWRGNDFHAESWIGKPIDEQVRILRRGRDFALGFAHWLQTAAPRDDGNGVGWPEMQLHGGGDAVAADGLALHPYVRESRRLVS